MATKLPSAQFVAAASNSTVVTDADGRKIKVRRISAVDKWELAGIAGAEHSSNQQWMSYAIAAFAVEEIDGHPQPCISEIKHLRAMIKKLDDAGLVAAATAIQELAGNKSSDDVKEEAKN
jgi:hypothetical protein